MTGQVPPQSGDRVADLMGAMTVAEKVGQLFGVWLGSDATGADVAPMQHDHAGVPDDWDELVRHGIGQLTRPYGTVPVDPVAGARGLADTQRGIVAANRFGIPALVHEECLTGAAAWQATVFPSPLCWGAAFDPPLVERMGRHIGATLRHMGVHQGLAPVVDVARDLRWGRVEETIGEDPYLVSVTGAAYVRGVQSAGVVATLKHFAGYSASRAGRNLAPVSMGPREFADVVLPPFEAALRAGAASVMNSYADVDGVPAAADQALLTGLLRDRLGFTGTVVADYFAVTFLHSLHGVAAGPVDAARLALTAGIDVELPNPACYGPELVAAVQAGDVPEALLDRALERVLRQKDRLGLLEPGWSPEPPLLADGADPALDDQQGRAIARELAQRSVVLLHNEGVLPLRPGGRIALVGPRADTAQAMLGCYSFPMHVGAHHPDVPIGVVIPTLRDALAADPAVRQVDYRIGCPVAADDGTDVDAQIAAAAAAAADADVCVAALGDQAGLFGGGTSGEGNDVTSLRLPGRQEDLLEALLATDKPVVLVLLVGRPYELHRQIDRLAAVVCGFFPGEEGASALADVLTGRVDPAGRLPIGFPGAGGAQPSTYLAPPLGRRTQVSEVDPAPLFAFGHGLSYTRVRWESAQLSDPTWRTDGSVRLSVTLVNEADRPASEVVQVYVHDPVAEVARPVQYLVAAPRVDLDPGARCTVQVDLHADQLSYTGVDLRRLVDSGDVEVWVGRSSVDLHARLACRVVGPTRYPGGERVLEPIVTVD